MKPSRQAISPEALARWKKARWRARTDLQFLCNHVLGMPDVNHTLNGGLLNALQQFPKPDARQFEENDRLVGKDWIYTPVTTLNDLRCSSRVLILDARGFMKTAINVIAHTIQWIINYPDVAMLIIQSNTDKAKLFLKEIKAHFTSNPVFRELFPEHCPTSKVFDWCTAEEFTTEARSKTSTRRESTCMIASIEKGVAGMHFDVMKFSDIVEENNSKNTIQCDAIYSNFNGMLNLLISPIYWVDIEGTRWNYSDCYGQIIDTELKLPDEHRTWKFYINSCFERKVTGGRTYGAEELSAPFAKTEDGNYISRWPERFPLSNLLAQQRADPRIFACQQLNCPVSSSDGRAPFPVDGKFPMWVPKSDFKQVRVAYREIVVDTAETDGKRSDFSAISCGAWDTDGRLYIEQIYHGKFLPDELIKLLVNAVKLHKPRYVNIEETSFVRGLKSSLGREMHKNGLFIPIRFIKRDNQASKVERITNTLQPWYKAGYIRFLDDIMPKQELIMELGRFPGYKHDDIMDTLADFFQNKSWFGREGSRPADHLDASTMAETQRQKALARLLGTDEDDAVLYPNRSDRAVNGVTTVI